MARKAGIKKPGITTGKKTPLQSAYEKEYKRLMRGVKAAEARGFEFPESKLPKYTTSPKRKTLEQLRVTSVSDLYRNAKYTEPETGIKMSGLAGRQLEMSKASQKGVRNRKVKESSAKQNAPIDLSKESKLSPEKPTPTPAKKAARKPKQSKVEDPVKKEFNKQYKRIMRGIRAAEKRGYIFPEAVIPQKLENPAPEDVETIKGISVKNLYKFAEYADPETGAIIPGIEGRKREQSKAAKKGKKPKETDEVLRKIEDMIDNYTATGRTALDQIRLDNQQRTLRAWLQAQIDKYKRPAVARAFQGHAEALVEATWLALFRYYEDLINCINLMAQYIKGSLLTSEESKEMTSEVESIYNNIT